MLAGWPNDSSVPGAVTATVAVGVGLEDGVVEGLAADGSPPPPLHEAASSSAPAAAASGGMRPSSVLIVGAPILAPAPCTVDVRPVRPSPHV